MGVDAWGFPGGLLRLDPAFAYVEPLSSWPLPWAECLTPAPNNYSMHFGEMLVSNKSIILSDISSIMWWIRWIIPASQMDFMNLKIHVYLVSFSWIYWTFSSLCDLELSFYASDKHVIKLFPFNFFFQADSLFTLCFDDYKSIDNEW